MRTHSKPRPPELAQVLVPLALLPLALTCAALAACGGDPAPSGPSLPVADSSTPGFWRVPPGWEARATEWAMPSSTPGITARAVTVLVPPGYSDAANAGVKYPVLYLHDGNNCLDHDPFGHGGWQAHTVSTDLVNAGQMKPAILVMVANSSKRTDEYNPGVGTPPAASADGYLDFLEASVIPFVEKNWRTLPGAANRAIGGSSFGGILSLYAGFTRPQVYGRVMAMSTAPSVYDVKARIDALTATAKLPLRVYLDSGTIDPFGPNSSNLYSDYRDYTLALRDLLASRGWTLDTDLAYVLGDGDAHNEGAWNRRLPGALKFLFPP